MAGGGKNRATSRTEWQDSARDKMRGTSIIKRLVEHTLSDEDVMSTSQVAAARILLSKLVPDVKAIEHTGDVTVNTGVIAVPLTGTKEEQLENYD